MNKYKIFILHTSTLTYCIGDFYNYEYCCKTLKLFTMFMHHKLMNKSDNYSVNLINKKTNDNVYVYMQYMWLGGRDAGIENVFFFF